MEAILFFLQGLAAGRSRNERTPHAFRWQRRRGGRPGLDSCLGRSRCCTARRGYLVLMPAAFGEPLQYVRNQWFRVQVSLQPPFEFQMT